MGIRKIVEMKVGLCVKIVLCLIVAEFFLPVSAAADGGAPNLAYVAGGGRGVSVIDVAQQKVIDTIMIGGEPSMTLLSPDGRLLYVAQPAEGLVTVVAAKTKQTLCSVALAGQPSRLALDPGTNTLFAAGNQASRVSALDPMTCGIKYTMQTKEAVTALGVALVGEGIAGGSGNQLWVADRSALYVFNAAGKQLTLLAMEEGPTYLCIPPGSLAYVATGQGTVEAVDLVTKKRLAAPLLTGGNFAAMDYDATTGEIYIPDLQHHHLAVLTSGSAETVASGNVRQRMITLDGVPQSVAITSDGQLGFVALSDGRVVMLDIPGRQVITTIDVGGTPRFIITGLYPSPVSMTPQQSFLLSLLQSNLDYIAGAIIVIAAIIIIGRERVRSRRQSARNSKP